MKNSPFSSFDAFRSAFNGGLAELLDGHAELGAYILVMAHAGFDAMLRENLSQPLKKRFEQIAREMRRGKRRELYLDAAEADLQVVRSIIDIDFEGVQPAQFRDIGPWELQFNQMRALRPARMAGEVVEVNQAIADDPSLVNSDPAGAGWFFKLKLDDATRAAYDLSSLQVAIHAAAPCPAQVTLPIRIGRTLSRGRW